MIRRESYTPVQEPFASHDELVGVLLGQWEPTTEIDETAAQTAVVSVLRQATLSGQTEPVAHVLEDVAVVSPRTSFDLTHALLAELYQQPPDLQHPEPLARVGTRILWADEALSPDQRIFAAEDRLSWDQLTFANLVDLELQEIDEAEIVLDEQIEAIEAQRKRATSDAQLEYFNLTEVYGTSPLVEYARTMPTREGQFAVLDQPAQTETEQTIANLYHDLLLFDQVLGEEPEPHAVRLLRLSRPARSEVGAIAARYLHDLLVTDWAASALPLEGRLPALYSPPLTTEGTAAMETLRQRMADEYEAAYGQAFPRQMP